MPWAKKANGLPLVIAGSNCLKLPAAAFLGFANTFSPFLLALSFKASKSDFLINTSPLTSSKSGNELSDSFSVSGIDLIVLILDVISSPIVPSPLVTPLVRMPFS